MGFAEDVRHELVEHAPSRACCRAAFLSGLIRGAGSLQVRRGGELAAVVELGHPAAARLAFSLLRERGADCEIVSYREHRFQRRNLVVLRVHGRRSLAVLGEVGVLSARGAPLPEPPRRVLARACCRGAYLRGAFVVSGSVSAPRRAAHLELRAPDLDHARSLAAIAARNGIELRTASRRGHAIAYAKRRAAIRALLDQMGAEAAVLSLDEAAVVARMLEEANRVTNCDRANLERASSAAHRQREAIAALDVVSLPVGLREVAQLRLSHPSSSFTELGQRAHPPLTKSTVVRRMRTLMRLAGEAHDC